MIRIARITHRSSLLASSDSTVCLPQLIDLRLKSHTVDRVVLITGNLYDLEESKIDVRLAGKMVIVRWAFLSSRILHLTMGWTWER